MARKPCFFRCMRSRMRCQSIVLAGLGVKIKNGWNMRKIKVVRPIYNRNLSDIKENGRKVMEFISIAHGNQKVRAKNSRNEEDSPKMPVETLKWDVYKRQDLDPLAQEKNIKLTGKCKNITMVGSDILIYRLVYNLVENAIKYNHSGGQVTVTAYRKEKHCLLYTSWYQQTVFFVIFLIFLSRHIIIRKITKKTVCWYQPYWLLLAG